MPPKKKAKRLISKAKLASEAGVTKQAVTKLCRGKLKVAVAGNSVDIDHPAVIEYLKARKKIMTTKGVKALKGDKKKPAKKKKKPTKKKEAPQDDEPEPEESHYSGDNDVAGVMDLTLRELIVRFGTAPQFKDWADAVKTVSDIILKDLTADEKKKKFIRRSLVKTHIFGAIENMNRRLLGDLPKTLVRRLFSMAKSGGSLEEGEALAHELISTILKGAKETAQKQLRKKNA